MPVNGQLGTAKDGTPVVWVESLGRAVPASAAKSMGVTPGQPGGAAPRKLNNQEQARLKEAVDGAEGARGMAQAANLFVDLNKKSGTGPINAIPGVPAMRSLFDKNQRQMQSLTARMAPQQRVPGSGTTSDKDLELFLQAVPSITAPGNANAAIAKDITDLSTRRAARAAFLDRWAEKKGTLMGADQAFASFWADYSKKAGAAPVATPSARGAKPTLDDIFN